MECFDSRSRTSSSHGPSRQRRARTEPSPTVRRCRRSRWRSPRSPMPWTSASGALSWAMHRSDRVADCPGPRVGHPPRRGVSCDSPAAGRHLGHRGLRPGCQGGHRDGSGFDPGPARGQVATGADAARYLVPQAAQASSAPVGHVARIRAGWHPRGPEVLGCRRFPGCRELAVLADMGSAGRCRERCSSCPYPRKSSEEELRYGVAASWYDAAADRRRCDAPQRPATSHAGSPRCPRAGAHICMEAWLAWHSLRGARASPSGPAVPHGCSG